MSGSSSITSCPRCGDGNFHIYADWKPFDAVSGDCPACGLTYWTETKIHTNLAALNSLRKEYGLPPVEALRKPLAEWVRNGHEPGAKS